MQRKDEILAKKAKLAELRRQREEREQRQKESGKRESLLGESSEVPCSYIASDERFRLTGFRAEPPRLLGRPTERSSTASLILWWEIDPVQEMLGHRLRLAEKAGLAPPLELEELVPKPMNAPRAEVGLPYIRPLPGPKHCRPLL